MHKIRTCQSVGRIEDRPPNMIQVVHKYAKSLGLNSCNVSRSCLWYMVACGMLSIIYRQLTLALSSKKLPSFIDPWFRLTDKMLLYTCITQE